MFRDRFWLSLALTFPVFSSSEMIQEWFGYTAPTFSGSGWVAPVLGTPRPSGRCGVDECLDCDRIDQRATAPWPRPSARMRKQ